MANRLSTVQQDGNTLKEQYYDAEGRLKELKEHRTANTSFSTIYAYDLVGHQVAKLEDANQVKTQTAYDGFGNVKAVVDGRFPTVDPNSSDANVAMRYQHDSLNRVTRQTDANAHTLLTVYEVFADPNVTHDRYQKTFLPDGQLVWTTFDKLGRKTKVQVGPNGGGNYRTEQTFTYDSLSRMILAVDYNGDYSGATKSHAVRYTYDKFSRITSEDQGVVNTGGAFTSQRNVQRSYTKLVSDPNHLTEAIAVTLPTASYTATSRYDDRGLLKEVQCGVGTMGYMRDGQGRVTASTNGALSLALHYDTMGREDTRTYTKNVDPNVFRQGTSYDLQNNVATDAIRYHDFAQRTYNYTHDGLSRLTGQNGDANASWTLDKAGNWTSTSQYPDASYGILNHTANANNEYTPSGNDPNVTYDVRGNMTRFGCNRYSYDWANRLTKVELTGDNGVTWQSRGQYEYDALNRRVRMLGLAASGSETLAWDGPRNIATYHDESGGDSGWRLTYYSSEGLRALGGSWDGTPYLLVLDRLGSTVAVTSTSGAICEMYHYSAYGVPYAIDGSGQDTAYQPYNSRTYVFYAGQLFDQDTALYYCRTRYYHPGLGRFLSRDGAGYVDGMNLYTYVRNNPHRYTDPMGMSAMGMSSVGSRWSMDLTDTAFSTSNDWDPMWLTQPSEALVREWDFQRELRELECKGTYENGQWVPNEADITDDPRRWFHQNIFDPLVSSPTFRHIVQEMPTLVASVVVGEMLGVGAAGFAEEMGGAEVPFGAAGAFDSGVVAGERGMLGAVRSGSVDAFGEVYASGFESGIVAGERGVWGAVESYASAEAGEAQVARVVVAEYPSGIAFNYPQVQALQGGIAPVLQGQAGVDRAMYASGELQIAAEAEGLYGAGEAQGILRGVSWVEEPLGMSENAAAYSAGATGARSNLLSRMPEVPQIGYGRFDGSFQMVRFDGLENGVLIDRKLAVTSFPKTYDQALRQSTALLEHGLPGCWEVPTAAEAARAQKLFDFLGIQNMTVKVVP